MGIVNSLRKLNQEGIEKNNREMLFGEFSDYSSCREKLLEDECLIGQEFLRILKRKECEIWKIFDLRSVLLFGKIGKFKIFGIC